MRKRVIVRAEDGSLIDKSVEMGPCPWTPLKGKNHRVTGGQLVIGRSGKEPGEKVK